MTIASHRLAGYSEDREPNDFYPTPDWATEALFRVESFQGAVLEPASGDGSMVNIIKKYNPCTLGDIRTVQDFFLERTYVENIITNPPFKHAERFIEHSKGLARNKIAMFLKLVFLEGQRRQGMFLDVSFPLARVHVFSKRVTLYAGGKNGKNSGTMAFAWFIWDKDHIGPATIHWL